MRSYEMNPKLRLLTSLAVGFGSDIWCNYNVYFALILGVFAKFDGIKRETVYSVWDLRVHLILRLNRCARFNELAIR